MTDYINKFDKATITISLQVKDKKLFKNYSKIWKKIEKLMDIDFNTKPTYVDDDDEDDDKYIKAKIKTYKSNITTNIYNKKGSKKVPEDKIPHKCLSIIILDSILYTYEKYYSQIFLEECKYLEENIKTKNYIDNEIRSESDIDSDSDSEIDSDTNNEE